MGESWAESKTRETREQVCSILEGKDTDIEKIKQASRQYRRGDSYDPVCRGLIEGILLYLAENKKV